MSDLKKVLFTPSPGTPGEGWGEGSLDYRLANQIEREPSPLPSPTGTWEREKIAYRLIRALPPPATCSSSSSVICDVSPMVLVSIAPCATPMFTHSCGVLPVRKP